MSKVNKYQEAQDAFFSACEGLISMGNAVSTPKEPPTPQELQKSIEAKLNKSLNQFLASLTPEEYEEHTIQKHKRGSYLVVEVYLGKGE